MATKSFSKDARIPAQVILDAFDALENKECYERRDVPVRELKGAQVGEFLRAIVCQRKCYNCIFCQIEQHERGEYLYLCLATKSKSRDSRTVIDDPSIEQDWCPLVDVDDTQL